MSNPNVSDWDNYLGQTEERAKSSGGGGDFVKLGAGDSIDIVFVTSGFPYRDEKYGKNRELFVVYDVKEKRNKVLDMSTFFVGGWIETLREYGPMHRYKLKREGADKNNTRYSLMPAKNGALTEEQIATVRALPQPDIAAIASKKEGAADRDLPEPTEGEDSGSIPF